MDCHGLSDRLAHTTGFSLKKRSQKCELHGLQFRRTNQTSTTMNNIREVNSSIPLHDLGIPHTMILENPSAPTIPLTRLQFRHQRLTNLFTEVEKQRRPGILDRIQSAVSLEAAHVLWHEFLEGANAVSQKTINKANRLLETLEFPLP